MKQGFIDESNNAYHGGEGISKSALDAISRSPHKYWAEYINPKRPERVETPAMQVGTAVHTAILEPDEFGSRYVAPPEGIDFRTKVGKAWKADQLQSGLTVLGRADFDNCIAMRDAVHNHPVVAPMVTGGIAEQSCYATDAETGLLTKCRPDYRRTDMIVDVKTINSFAANDFGRAVANYRYHVQEAHYSKVLASVMGERLPFRFLVIESAYPYSMGVYSICAEDVERGKVQAFLNLHQIKDHTESDYWPDDAMDGVVEVEMPVWARIKNDNHE